MSHRDDATTQSRRVFVLNQQFPRLGASAVGYVRNLQAPCRSHRHDAETQGLLTRIPASSALAVGHVRNLRHLFSVSPPRRRVAGCFFFTSNSCVLEPFSFARSYVVSGFSRTSRGPPEGGHYVHVEIGLAPPRWDMCGTCGTFSLSHRHDAESQGVSSSQAIPAS